MNLTQAPESLCHSSQHVLLGEVIEGRVAVDISLVSCSVGLYRTNTAAFSVPIRTGGKLSVQESPPKPVPALNIIFDARTGIFFNGTGVHHPARPFLVIKCSSSGLTWRYKLPVGLALASS